MTENPARESEGIAETIVATVLILVSFAGAVYFHGKVDLQASSVAAQKLAAFGPLLASFVFSAIGSVRRWLVKATLAIGASMFVRRDGKIAGVSLPAFVVAAIILSSGVYVVTAITSHGVAQAVADDDDN